MLIWRTPDLAAVAAVFADITRCRTGSFHGTAGGPSEHPMPPIVAFEAEVRPVEDNSAS